ncbi:GNAT family N-acetyltransferase [Streptomyces prunicolor]|uniref:GNAT family N-acetyltransferase n=1 Tax=Streptomyces prunicolor TaxID=67348 RepID=UPI003570B612
MVLLDRRDAVVGRLRFRACRECGTGWILDVWIHDEWQRRGLGRELVHSLLALFPGFRWSTTLQTRPGRPFFTAMAEETSAPFPRGGPLCAHLSGPLTRAWRRALRLLTSRPR